jgi:hypothetical protein
MRANNPWRAIWWWQKIEYSNFGRIGQMAAYNDLNTFLTLARAVDPKIDATLKKGWGRGSSLKPLVELLGKNSCSAQKICSALEELAKTSDKTYVTKANKYKSAIYHLELTYPIPANQRVPVFTTKQKKRSNAIRYNRGATEPSVKDWQKGNAADPGTWIARGFNFALPSSIQSLAGTVEDFILRNPATGVIIIHLQNHEHDMDLTYDGFTAVQHINSVLNVARRTASGLCVLRVTNAAAVCASILHEYNQFPAPLTPQVERHSGFHSEVFRTFVTGKTDIVLAGFQADMCVHINMFGGELLVRTAAEIATHAEPRPASALLAHTNVITSRPLVVSEGNSINRQEYGILRHK